MTSMRTKATLSLILTIVDLSPEGKKIFGIHRLCNLNSVKVEVPHKKGIIGKCHRCQFYGHSARNSYVRPRCVKNTGDHGTKECSRTAEATNPLSYVLCKAERRPANYRWCS